MIRPFVMAVPQQQSRMLDIELGNESLKCGQIATNNGGRNSERGLRVWTAGHVHECVESL